MAYTRKKASERGALQQNFASKAEEVAKRLRSEAATETGEARDVMLGFAAINDAHVAHHLRMAAAYARVARGETAFPAGGEPS